MNKPHAVYNALFAQKVLITLSISWVIYHAIFYLTVLSNRPAELYEPLTWFGKLFIPRFPGPLGYFLVASSGILSAIFLLTGQKYKVATRSVFVFGLLYVNSVRWSYGYLSHVGHFIILANLLAIFIPSSLHTKKHERIDYTLFKWYYAALLSTYTFSALWKLETIIVDLINGDFCNSWLNPKATINTSVSGYIWMNEEIPESLIFLYSYPLLLSMLFIITTIIMLLAPISVINHRIFVLTVLFLILFHIGNMLLFRAEFFITPVSLLLFIIPYHRFIKQKQAL